MRTASYSSRVRMSKELNPVGFEQILGLPRRDHHALILLPSQPHVLHHVFGIKTAIPVANVGQRLIRPESATRAAADVIVSKKSSLSARIGFEQGSHRHVRCGCHLGQATRMRR